MENQTTNIIFPDLHPIPSISSSFPINSTDVPVIPSADSFSLLALEQPDPADWSNSDGTLNAHRIVQAILMLLHYTVVLPLFVLCSLAFVRWLRRMGMLRDQNANRLLRQPPEPPTQLFKPSTSLNGRSSTAAVDAVVKTAADAASIVLPMMLVDEMVAMNSTSDDNDADDRDHRAKNRTKY